MKLTEDLLVHLETLARLELSPEERTRLRADLERILDYVEAINALDLSGVEPMTRPVEEAGGFRADAPRPSLPQEEVLANAPEREDGFFRVPRSVE